MRALVTGAAVRVGKAIALELAKAGFDVAIHYRRSKAPAEATAAELKALGVKAPLVAGDQAREPERIVREAVEALGGLELLVCSAAEFEKVPAAQIDRSRFEAMLAANLTGPFFLMQAARAALTASRGSIVTLLDLCGTSQVWPGYAHYAAAKGGLATLTRLLAVEWAPHVRVNGVAPGTVEFPADLSGDERSRIARRIPAGHVGKPQDVARAVLYFASAGFVTGQILAVDGGRSANP